MNIQEALLAAGIKIVGEYKVHQGKKHWVLMLESGGILLFPYKYFGIPPEKGGN